MEGALLQLLQERPGLQERAGEVQFVAAELRASCGHLPGVTSAVALDVAVNGGTALQRLMGQGVPMESVRRVTKTLFSAVAGYAEEGTLANAPVPWIEQMETAIVTGGCGFIGSHTVEALLRRGFRVAMIDMLTETYDLKMKYHNVRSLVELAKEMDAAEDCAAEGAAGNVALRPAAATCNSRRLAFYEVDIADTNAMEAIFAAEQPSYVVHLAAAAGVRASIRDPSLYARSNVLGTTNVLECAHRHGVRSVAMASSSSVYGDRPAASQRSWLAERGLAAPGDDAAAAASAAAGDEEDDAFAETDEVSTPESPYAATKRSTELIAFAFSKLHKLPVACLRFFTVYGPRGRPDMAPFKFMDRIAQGIAIDRYGDGSAIRDFTYVGDIVEGILLSLFKGDGYQIFNLGGGRPVTLSHFIETVEMAIERRATINVLPTQPGDVARTHASVTKARRELGFEARVRLEDGMKLMAAWYRAFKASPEAPRPIPSPVPIQAAAATTAAAAADQVAEDEEAGRKVAEEEEGEDGVDRGSVASSPRAHAQPADAGPAAALALAPSAGSAGDQAASSAAVGSARSGPAPLAVCTRIHGGGLSEARAALLKAFVRQTVAIPGGRAVVATELNPDDGGRLLKQVQSVAKEAADELGLDQESGLVTVLPVCPWGITTALNACVNHAASLNGPHVAFRSLEVAVEPRGIERLVAACDQSTLVAGARLPGHVWGASGEVAGSGAGAAVASAVSGRAVPWNTLAVWNLAQLSTVGFVLVANGGNVVLGTGDAPLRAGMEEVATIAAHRRLAAEPLAVKLLDLAGAGLTWDTSFADDPVRLAKHAKKMASKDVRAVRQLAVTRLTNFAGTVQHMAVPAE